MTTGLGLLLQALLLPLLAGLGMAATALPENLRVDAVNTRFILKWDWDFEKNPNVTFSVEKCGDSVKQWRTVRGCENTTALDCNVSDLDSLLIIYNFRVSVYNSQTGERNSYIVRFHPLEDTVIGPPAGLNMTFKDGNLYFVVEPPEGLKVESLRDHCNGRYHLQFWRNATPTEVFTKNNTSPHFRSEAVQASTTYCARAHVTCEYTMKPGLPSKDYCLTTDPRSYVKEWIIGSVFLAIAVLSVMVYVCLCPLQRYMKHVFYPKSKLPSSIEKFFQDSPRNDMRNPVHVPEEEPTDQCIILTNSQTLDAGC